MSSKIGEESSVPFADGKTRLEGRLRSGRSYIACEEAVHIVSDIVMKPGEDGPSFVSQRWERRRQLLG
jgi:hypothetical protein